jgi:hypothetical protein
MSPIRAILQKHSAGPETAIDFRSHQVRQVHWAGSAFEIDGAEGTCRVGRKRSRVRGVGVPVGLSHWLRQSSETQATVTSCLGRIG